VQFDHDRESCEDHLSVVAPWQCINEEWNVDCNRRGVCNVFSIYLDRLYVFILKLNLTEFVLVCGAFE